jgi:hypothetical protein
MLKHAHRALNVHMQDITGVGETVHLSGSVKGAVSGEITLQKL